MVKKIVLTGGPSSGKTTILNYIYDYYTDKGFKVIILDESATYLVNKGIVPYGKNSINLNEFEELILKIQFNNESLVDRYLEMSNLDNAIVIYDRGVIDALAYVNNEDFYDIINNKLNIKKSILELFSRYDLVINLLSSEDFYTKENNVARREDALEGLKIGKVNLYNYLGHNNLKIVGPKEIFEDKVKEVINYINSKLYDNIKKQEKYLIDIDNTDKNYIIQNSKCMSITQTYLKSDKWTEERVREVEYENSKTYYYSRYNIVGNFKIEVLNKEIDNKEYLELLTRKDINLNTIKKKRYYFTYEDEYLYVDEFDDFWLLEINGLNDYYVKIPPYIKVIKRVSEDKKYENKYLARKR